MVLVQKYINRCVSTCNPAKVSPQSSDKYSMALVIKRAWNPKGGEAVVLSHLVKLFRDEPHDVYLFHNVYLGSVKEDEKTFHAIKPDFFILDPKRGIAIVEIKDWKEFTLEGDYAILSNGERDLNPIIKGQNYFFNFSAILKNKEIKLDPRRLKSHLVFTKMGHDLLLQGDFVTSHFKDFHKTLTIESLFSQPSAMHEDVVNQVRQVLCPVETFFTGSDDWKKEICELDSEQIKHVCKSPYGHYLLSGIPGSGKSIMVSSRAMYLSEEIPDWKILVLSVNRRLNDKIARDIKERSSTEHNIECQTLKGFLEKMCPPSERANLYRIKDYKEQMAFLRQKASPTPQWDAILVDEYQDFTDDDLTIILNSCIKHPGIINGEIRETENLFLSGDKLQEIWDNGCSHTWESLGIHIKGRSRILKSSYRSPSGIVKVALEYLMSAGLKDEVKQFYEGTDDIEHLNSKKNAFSFDVGWDQEAVHLYSKVQGALIEGALPSEILVLAFSAKDEKLLETVFKKEIEKGLVVGTHNTVKGLEFAYVFMYNLGSLDFYFAKSPKQKAKSCTWALLDQTITFTFLLLKMKAAFV